MNQNNQACTMGRTADIQDTGDVTRTSWLYQITRYVPAPENPVQYPENPAVKYNASPLFAGRIPEYHSACRNIAIFPVMTHTGSDVLSRISP